MKINSYYAEDFQPGDMTRYRVFAAVVGTIYNPELFFGFGVAGEPMNAGLLPLGVHLTRGYVMEKLGIKDKYQQALAMLVLRHIEGGLGDIDEALELWKRPYEPERFEDLPRLADMMDEFRGGRP